MKNFKVLLIAGLTAIMCLTGCGDKAEEAAVSSEIEEIVVEKEEIPVAEEVTEAPEEEAVEEELPPGEGYVRSSLTNLWVKEEVANARPIAVMMPTDSEAQPQYNIGNAGVLYECMEEGSISRQMAIIEDWQGMEKIGNIRSCRRYYIYMGMEWDAIIVHFGGVFYMEDLITREDVDNISGTSEYGTGGSAPGANSFFRSTDKSSPHNAYNSGENLTKAIESLGYEKEHRSKYWEPNHFTFTTASAPNTLEEYADAKPATKVDLSDVFPVTKSYLEYNEEEGVYYKWLHNKEQIDAATDKQLSFENIIVQYTESASLDEKGYKAFAMVDERGLDGLYITKGKAIPITWKKTDDYAPTKYYDKNGKEIVLNTGKTYIAVAEQGTEAFIQ